MLALHGFLLLLGHFQTNECKVQTFAYNSGTIWSTNMKFANDLKLLICMFIPNFEAISLVTLLLGPQNRPKSLA